ncbi:A24 family peptidase [Sphingomonas xanthus]|uniref:Prepilin type IV endopeptidase peptidase domain-containing protein n=1 Tax=Sphingomonas xanthus TaxID=2594473 RepID=A0A516IRB9_9SPHN|nr:prepilin peptidase [Sphingomonas xanthus]QDP19463.1 hypothetical protein FMM02_05495 [Sphingomonas xanthus]
MTLIESAPHWLFIALLTLLGLAALEDGWRLKIGNWISALIAIGAFAALLGNGPIVGFWQNLLLCGLTLMVGTGLFARGIMGGGDVKLLAASALWFDLSSGWKMLVAIAIAGGLEAIIVLLARLLPWFERARQRVALIRRGGGIPYGIAIAAGVILVGVWLRS